MKKIGMYSSAVMKRSVTTSKEEVSNAVSLMCDMATGAGKG